MPEETNEVQSVVKAKISERLTKRQNKNWLGEDSAEVVRACVTTSKDRDGNPIKLTAAEDVIITVLSRPTHDVQMMVIRNIITAHNATMDNQAENAIRRVINAASFKLELIKKGKITGSDESDDLLG